MRRSTRNALTVLLVSAVALGLWFARPRNETDSQIIQSQIASATRGASRKSIGAIMAVISTSYLDDNDLNSDRLRFALGRAFRSSQDIAVQTTEPVVAVHGDDATSDFSMTIRDDDTQTLYYSHPVHLMWHKEKGFQYLIMPTTIWRITKADYGPLFGDEG